MTSLAAAFEPAIHNAHWAAKVRDTTQALLIGVMLLTDPWAASPTMRRPRGQDAHVWWTDVPLWRPRVPMLRRLLAWDERARADSFRFEKDADRMIISRGVLRLLIGQSLGVPPERVHFTYSATGKPAVGGLEFNVAHSGDVILIATHLYPIGVDVERVDRTVDIAGIARSCFTTREHALILGEGAAHETFFRLWTRKEAWLKAVGTGLSFPLQAVDVADAHAPVIALDALIEGMSPTRIVDLPVQHGYAAACAMSGPDCRVRLCRVERTW